VIEEWQALSALPERTPAQIDAKKERFAVFAQSARAGLLRTIADIPVAQFYISKVPGNEAKLVTDGEFRDYWLGHLEGFHDRRNRQVVPIHLTTFKPQCPLSGRFLQLYPQVRTLRMAVPIVRT
jgi:hypothetical protein